MTSIYDWPCTQTLVDGIASWMNHHINHWHQLFSPPRRKRSQVQVSRWRQAPQRSLGRGSDSWLDGRFLKPPGLPPLGSQLSLRLWSCGTVLRLVTTKTKHGAVANSKRVPPCSDLESIASSMVDMRTLLRSWCILWGQTVALNDNYMSIWSFPVGKIHNSNDNWSSLIIAITIDVYLKPLLDCVQIISGKVQQTFKLDSSPWKAWVQFSKPRISTSTASNMVLPRHPLRTPLNRPIWVVHSL